MLPESVIRHNGRTAEPSGATTARALCSDLVSNRSITTSAPWGSVHLASSAADTTRPQSSLTGGTVDVAVAAKHFRDGPTICLVAYGLAPPGHCGPRRSQQ